MGAVAQRAHPDTVSFIDIAGTRIDDGVRLIAPRLRPEEAALRGRFLVRTLRCGLTLHMSDAVDLHDLTTQATVAPGMTVSLFLQGRVGISVAGRRHEVGACPNGSGAAVPAGFLYTTTGPDLFERRGVRGQRMRKVCLRIPTGWLEDAGDVAGGDHLVRQLAADHGAALAWPLGHDLARLAGAMLDGGGDGEGLAAELFQESRALDILGRAFQAIGGPAAPSRRPARAEARVAAACAYIEAHLDEPLSLTDVARHAAVSVSTLQRLFRDVVGLSVGDHLRRLRMDRARRLLEHDGASVTEAALVAGYGSAANFATAFKRLYGLTPSECRRTLVVRPRQRGVVRPG
ncbi:AraC family transcriptional regulator [Caenispirillum bisanense]|uniref:helix-turn-helix transcriptional regulator n=1 Tax=Caenispirillum bisanense TaxID=414052 RepID=UPI0031DED327